jgi:hypothetical protein
VPRPATFACPLGPRGVRRDTRAVVTSASNRGRVVRTPAQMSSYIPWPSYGWFGLALISKLIVRSAALKLVWPTGRSGASLTVLHLLLRADFLQSSRDLS